MEESLRWPGRAYQHRLSDFAYQNHFDRSKETLQRLDEAEIWRNMFREAPSLPVSNMNREIRLPFPAETTLAEQRRRFEENIRWETVLRPETPANNLEIRLLAAETSKLQKKKDELAQKTAEQKVAYKPESIRRQLLAEKTSLQAVIEQRDVLIQSFATQAAANRVEEVWDCDMATRHIERRLREQYGIAMDEAETSMKRNIKQLEAYNMQLKADNDSIKRELSRSATRLEADIKLANAVGSKISEDRIKTTRDGLASSVSGIDLKHLEEVHRLMWLRQDLDERCIALGSVLEQAKLRNSSEVDHPKDVILKAADLHQREHQKQDDRVAFLNVSKGLQEEKDVHLSQIDILESQLRIVQGTHVENKRHLEGRAWTYARGDEERF